MNFPEEEICLQIYRGAIKIILRKFLILDIEKENRENREV